MLFINNFINEYDKVTRFFALFLVSILSFSIFTSCSDDKEEIDSSLKIGSYVIESTYDEDGWDTWSYNEFTFTKGADYSKFMAIAVIDGKEIEILNVSNNKNWDWNKEYDFIYFKISQDLEIDPEDVYYFDIIFPEQQGRTTINLYYKK